MGEVRLDYHWPIPKEEQQALFEAEIRCALELESPSSCMTERRTQTYMPSFKKVCAEGRSALLFRALPATPYGWRGRACISALAAR